MTGRPSPFELWQQANGDREEYRRLMWEHGHLIAREPGDDSPLFACGWKPKAERSTEVSAVDSVVSYVEARRLGQLENDHETENR